MGETFSKPTTAPVNPSDFPNANPSELSNPTHKTFTADSNPVKSDPQLPDPKTTEAVSDANVNPDKPISDSAGEDEEGEEDEYEEEEECGFCLFMKGGGCKEAFTVWEDCVNEAKDEDIVEKCAAVNFALKECMVAHADYYGPIIRMEKAAEEEALRELEKAKEAEGSGQATGSSDSETNVSSKDLKPESGQATGSTDSEANEGSEDLKPESGGQ